MVFKSPDFGKTWEQISPDLTTNDPEKLKDAGGPVAIENTTAEYHGTIISIAESPVQKGQIWVGTDDGNLQVTTDGGTMSYSHAGINVQMLQRVIRGVQQLRGTCASTQIQGAEVVLCSNGGSGALFTDVMLLGSDRP